MKEIRARVKTKEASPDPEKRLDLYLTCWPGHVERNESKSEDEGGKWRRYTQERLSVYILLAVHVEKDESKSEGEGGKGHRQTQQRFSIYILQPGHVERDESKSEDEGGKWLIRRVVAHINATSVARPS
ncbi:hypothetical protein EDD21DRAFT_406797 [Dissophora ornata]|nr:hypothetical protein EDD21DRAFT_406797 [Dissophora ornata]